MKGYEEIHEKDEVYGLSVLQEIIKMTGGGVKFLLKACAWLLTKGFPLFIFCYGVYIAWNATDQVLGVDFFASLGA